LWFRDRIACVLWRKRRASRIIRGHLRTLQTRDDDAPGAFRLCASVIFASARGNYVVNVSTSSLEFIPTSHATPSLSPGLITNCFRKKKSVATHERAGKVDAVYMRDDS
jgi:hypothetical protein